MDNLHVKLCDFGLARFKSHATITWAGHEGIGGTFAFMAPEVLIGVQQQGQMKRMKPQPSSDVWAMCCTNIKWFTKKHPWIYSDQLDFRQDVEQKQKARLLPEQLQNVPEGMAEILTKGLDYDHTTRPSAEHMIDMIG